MSNGKGASELSAITEAITSQLGEGRPRTRPMPAPSQLMNMTAGFQEARDELARLKRDAGKPIRVRMDLCDDGPSHTTPLDPERVKNLKANLAENPQGTPAVLRLKADGRFEIISGRHRKAALIELGHEEWDAVIREFDDDQAERLTFYDNLFAPSISDYAKFRGFAQRKENRGLSLDQLAKESGKSKGMVAGLMSFARLPEEALAIIAGNQKQFGFNMVSKLALLVDESRDAVIKVVELVATGKLKQDEAVDQVRAIAAQSQGQPAQRRKEREGRLTVEWEGKQYATIEVSAKKLTITFADKGESESVRKAVLKALEERAKKVRS